MNAKKERDVERRESPGSPARAGAPVAGALVRSRPNVARDFETEAYLRICQKRVSAAGLAELLGVSLPTASRVVAQLRKGGVNVVSVRDTGGWHYEIHEKRNWREDPLVQGLGCVKRWKPEPMKDEDEIIYGKD